MCVYWGNGCLQRYSSDTKRFFGGGDLVELELVVLHGVLPGRRLSVRGGQGEGLVVLGGHLGPAAQWGEQRLKETLLSSWYGCVRACACGWLRLCL